MAASVPKQYLPLAGQPLLARTLGCVADWRPLAGVIVALAAGDRRFDSLELPAGLPVETVDGGETRAESVQAALEALAGRAAAEDWVLVHDAARPCVSPEDVQRLCETVADDPVGGLLALPVAETVKRADAEDRVADTVDRRSLWLAQTPQMFRFGLLRDSLAAALGAGHTVTDESSAVEFAGHRPRLVAGSVSNIKITRPGDLSLAARLLETGD
jgi:2-C-methyl-D-erythritol 4-phosphate cytidylyltransferase